VNGANQDEGFLWMAVDGSGKPNGPQHIYSDALQRTLKNLLIPYLLSPPPPSSAVLNDVEGDVMLTVVSESRRNFVVTSSSYLGNRQLAQKTLLQSGQHGEKDHQSWREFKDEAFEMSPNLPVAELDSQRTAAIRAFQPLAFTVRNFDGVLPATETVHMTLAGLYFAQICGMRYFPPSSE
jgi:hypothetical protein